MITWMQKHKKWLIITIWVSTIAFIGAGFVGWGAYSYGDKASSVAKVGEVEISVGEYQKAYSRLYTQYAQLFGGQFDEEKAKMFGLKKQALQQLINQALILNLAKEYDISVSDEELTQKIITLPYFQTNGKFDKQLYKQLLSQNNISIKEFEEGLRKDLVVAKLIQLLPVTVTKTEEDIIQTKYNIADKIKYKLLTSKNITVTPTKAELKQFWEPIKEKFKTLKQYKIAYITQPTVTKEYDDTTLQSYYNENKTHFRGEDGKILPFDQAKKQVIQELNQKETKKAALKKYIAFKKKELPAEKQLTISAQLNPFNNPEVFTKVSQASMQKPYLKPIKEGNAYIIIEILEIVPAKTKTFEEALADVTPVYIEMKKKEQLQAIATKELENFTGKRSDFITLQTKQPLPGLDKTMSTAFITKLFTQQTKKGIITLNDQNVVLYEILEQKLLNNPYTDAKKEIEGIKQTIFDRNFIKVLQNKYDIEIYKGL